LKRHLTFLLVFSVVTVMGGSVAAHPDQGQGRLDSGEDITEYLSHQHPGAGGHLPATQHNVDLVSKLRLTNIDNGIADVGYFKGYAYLAARDPSPATCPTAGGVHVVDVRNPSSPQAVGFLQANVNEFPGEGIHVMEVHTPFFDGDLLLHNNEACNTSASSVLGMAVWNVTDPLNPVKLSQFGDALPAIAGQPSTYHSIHSVQGFTQGNKAYAVMIDNNETQDIDIVDITDPSNPVLIAERGLSNFAAGVTVDANGSTVFHHDVQFKRIGGHDFLAVSYWDAGQLLLNVDDPANPVFLGDSDYPHPDPLTGFEPPEGNSHESYWSSNNKFLISTDEDFSPTRLLCEITSGAATGGTPCGQFGFTPPIETIYPDGFDGTTVWGGSGCPTDQNGDGISDRDQVPDATSSNQAIVFSRGVCFFSEKIETGELAGYQMVLIGNSHAGSQNGFLPDAFFCGGQGSPIAGTAASVCIGHRAMHQLFDDPLNFTGPEFTDMPDFGALGHGFAATPGVFDGWGYVNLHDATNRNLPIIDSYAIPEALDPAFQSGFGALSVHEVKTDPRQENLGYLSYYSGGFRVIRFSKKGINEVGRFIDEGGNDFWGVFPIGDETVGHGYSDPITGENPHVLLSDRDFGLYVFRYTGS
jgi:hypothetical protein